MKKSIEVSVLNYWLIHDINTKRLKIKVEIGIKLSGQMCIHKKELFL